MTIANVTGHATIEAKPDEAHMSVCINARGHRTAEDAYTDFADRLDVVRKLLARDGIEHWTGTPSTYVYTDDKEERHHSATGTVTVKITDLTQVAGLVTDLMTHPDIEPSRVRWDVSKRRDLERQARIDAIAAAHAVADDYATALDMSVIGIQSVSDHGPAQAGATYLEAAAPRGAALSFGGPAERPALDLTDPQPVIIDGTVHVSYRLGGRPLRGD